MPTAQIAFAWESFGPSHLDRIDAAAAAGYRVTAIEFSRSSRDYQWEDGELSGAQRVVLTRSGERIGPLRLGWRLFRSVRQSRANAAFLCHYELPAVFLAAVLLRLTGCRVIAMMVSKFDDYPRYLWREAFKGIMLAP